MLAGIFKFNPLGFAAGGIVQATTMAYLTRVIGDSFLDYLEHGKPGAKAECREPSRDTSRPRAPRAGSCISPKP